MNRLGRDALLNSTVLSVRARTLGICVCSIKRQSIALGKLSFRTPTPFSSLEATADGREDGGFAGMACEEGEAAVAAFFLGCFFLQFFFGAGGASLGVLQRE